MHNFNQHGQKRLSSTQLVLLARRSIGGLHICKKHNIFHAKPHNLENWINDPDSSQFSYNTHAIPHAISFLVNLTNRGNRWIWLNSLFITDRYGDFLTSSGFTVFLGIPMYGRAWTLKSAQDVSVGAPTVSAAQKGRFTAEAGILAYYEVDIIK